MRFTEIIALFLMECSVFLLLLQPEKKSTIRNRNEKEIIR